MGIALAHVKGLITCILQDFLENSSNYVKKKRQKKNKSTYNIQIIYTNVIKERACVPVIDLLHTLLPITHLWDESDHTFKQLCFT